MSLILSSTALLGFCSVCCLFIALCAGLLRIRFSPLSILITPFKVDRKLRHLAVGEILIIFYIPRWNRPQWVSLSLRDLEYRSVASQHFTVSQVHITMRFFPLLFSRHRPTIDHDVGWEPAFISVTLDDFRLRVTSSQSTPSWLVSLRRNVLDTILNEETQRLDLFRLKILFSTLKSRARLDARDDTEHSDESRITHISSDWHLHNHVTSRLYQFGQLTAQLCRNWKDDTGTFTFIAEDCHWVRSPQEAARRSGTSLYPFLTYIRNMFFSTFIPVMLYTLYSCPIPTLYYILRLVEIHISRADVTFDSFHISDAEPLQHGVEHLRRNVKSSRLWSTFMSKYWALDAILAVIGL